MATQASTSTSEEQAQQTLNRYEESVNFLSGLFNSDNARGRDPDQPQRPHVTLTFAQTIDGYIAGKKGRQLRLSGDESMAMTHYLRTVHDAILVGVGTVINDNPRLNARLLPNPPALAQQPRPIILDTHLRTPADCRLLTNYQQGLGRQPVILHSEGCEGQDQKDPRVDLEAAGAQLIALRTLDWDNILEALGKGGLKVQRLMVEGGAKVIETLLTSSSRFDGDGRAGGLIDSLVITVSPNFAGSDATGYKSPRWQDVVVKTGKQSVAARDGQEEVEEGTQFHVAKKAWFGDDAVWMWKRGEKPADK